MHVTHSGHSLQSLGLQLFKRQKSPVKEVYEHRFQLASNEMVLMKYFDLNHKTAIAILDEVEKEVKTRDLDKAIARFSEKHPDRVCQKDAVKRQVFNEGTPNEMVTYQASAQKQFKYNVINGPGWGEIVDNNVNTGEPDMTGLFDDYFQECVKASNLPDENAWGVIAFQKQSRVNQMIRNVNW